MAQRFERYDEGPIPRDFARGGPAPGPPPIPAGAPGQPPLPGMGSQPPPLPSPPPGLPPPVDTVYRGSAQPISPPSFGPGPSTADPVSPQSSSVWQAILARLQGGTRYTPEVMSQLLGGARMSAEGNAAAQQDELRASQAARGIARADFSADQERQVRQNVYNQTFQAEQDLTRAKIDADYQDKTEAIRSGMEWLNSMRQYVAQQSATSAQREVGLANVELGYRRLNQELQVLRDQYAQQVDLLERNAALNLQQLLLGL